MTRPFVIGLTGSIGMGKSTTAQMFADAGVPVWSADDAVHRLYSKGGLGTAALETTYSEAIADGRVDRSKLSRMVEANPDILGDIERKIHPLVADDRARFLASTSSDLVLLDIPLLFETNLDGEVDAIVVVTAPEHIQRQRVLERDGMTNEKLDMILSKQLPDHIKRERADFIIETLSLEEAREGVQNVVNTIKSKRAAHARNRT